MLCASCGTDHPETANYCMNCGIPLRDAAAAESAPFKWEYRDLTIPLDLSSKGRDFVRRYDHIVLTHLQQVGQDGWHPVDPVDWGSTFGSGRVRRVGKQAWYRILGIGRNSYRWDSVTIRLKRIAPG